MNIEAEGTLDQMEKDGAITYPVTCDELQKKARNWTQDKNITTFFEELPHKTFHSREEILEAGPPSGPGDVATPSA